MHPLEFQNLPNDYYTKIWKPRLAPAMVRPTRLESKLPGTATIGHKTIKQYISAIMDLYKSQVAKGENVGPSPHTATIKQYMKNVRIQLGKRGVQLMDDRGIPNNAITVCQYQSLCIRLSPLLIV